MCSKTESFFGLVFVCSAVMVGPYTTGFDDQNLGLDAPILGPCVVATAMTDMRFSSTVIDKFSVKDNNPLTHARQ